MKPHEETLAQSPTMPSEIVRREDGWTVGFARDGDMAQLWSAAPEMARALLASGRIDPRYPDSAWHTHECWDNGKASCDEQCTLTRAVLDKAGVLP